MLWALAAMVGCAAYFIISADESNGLPPLTLAAGGLVAGTAALGLLGLVGLMPMRATTTLGRVRRAHGRLVGPDDPAGPGDRRPSPTPPASPPSAAWAPGVASFVALTEVLAGVVWAWVLLDQLPRPVQLLGGLLILAGVVAVKLGERTVAETEPVSA